MLSEAQERHTSAKPAADERQDPLAVNRQIAAQLEDYAQLLDQQGADGFRSRAYRRAARTLEELDRPVNELLASEGRAGLTALPGIGQGIAGAIAEMVAGGRWSQLDRLRGELAPEFLFRMLPGVGPELARRLADEAQLESLEDLEAALYLGGLEAAGFGPRRRAMLRAALAERLGRPIARGPASKAPRPSVAQLLELDRIYRDKAAKGELRLIAPKRFNPTGEAWLPVMHVRRGKWQFTVLYSNTHLAHELNKTGDWVVIYYHAEGQPEGRCTVVTETRGPHAGRRVVRGREAETPMVDSR